jgi:hypothetical protein
MPRPAGPFGEVLQYYAMERFLYRLSVSPHARKFVLKGALMLTAWRAPVSRPTMDIDLLGTTNNEIEAIVQQMREVVQVDVPDDGIVFDPTSFTGGAIRGDSMNAIWDDLPGRPARPDRRRPKMTVAKDCKFISVVNSCAALITGGSPRNL